MGDHGYHDTSVEEDRRAAEYEAREREQGYRLGVFSSKDYCLDCGCMVDNRSIHDRVCAPKLARRALAEVVA